MMQKKPFVSLERFQMQGTGETICVLGYFPNTDQKLMSNSILILIFRDIPYWECEAEEECSGRTTYIASHGREKLVVPQPIK